MKIRPFILSGPEQKKLRALKEYAEQHPYSLDDLLDLINNKGRIAGDDPNFKCFIPVGYCIVFSLEQQPKGLTRHLSMSVDEERCLPGFDVVEFVMTQLGFEKKLEDCIVALEDLSPETIGPPNRQAVNVYEIISNK